MIQLAVPVKDVFQPELQVWFSSTEKFPGNAADGRITGENMAYTIHTEKESENTAFPYCCLFNGGGEAVFSF